MRAIWKIISSTSETEPVFSGGVHVRPLVLVLSPRARQMRLVVSPRDGTVRLTIPRRAGLSDARRWAESKRDWIEAQLATLPQPQPIVPGMTLMVAGDTLRLDWSEDHPRKPDCIGSSLRVGGPRESLDGRVLRWLKSEARALLEKESCDLAARLGVTLGRVGVGDPVSRWGSCSPSGDIRYSWRLILAPAAVRRATVAHEVAHRVHMNHGPRFHALVAELLGEDPAVARRWLRAHGAGLHWFGRSS
jgi:predicted metal-dependent hydrolase